MFTISFVNVLQISLLTLSIFGILLLLPYRQYRAICMLFALVIVAAIFNLLEELDITRNIHLVTPIFIIGFGPAIYLAIKGLLGNKLRWTQACHFIPMLVALPFTAYTEAVIAIGTAWRVIYAILSLKIIFSFHKQIAQQRSDAFDLSMNWLAWSLAIMTFVSMLNLVRLNIQPMISHTHNLIGQGISTGITLLFIMLLIRQLVHQKDALFSLLTDEQQESASQASPHEEVITNPETPEQNNAHFEQLFKYLSEEISTKQWYKTPRLSLNQLSELSGLQSRDISRAINIVTKQNFNDYINQLRLDEVVRQMEQKSEHSLLILATEAGFNSKSTFNTAFKRHHEVTPAEYRNSLNN